MATHFTCDRCGKPATRGCPQYAESTVQFAGKAERLNVTWTIFRPAADDEIPDLCGHCHAEFLHDVASQRDTDQEPAVHG